jgi:hypothetical protein
MFKAEIAAGTAWQILLQGQVTGMALHSWSSADDGPPTGR